MQLTAIACADAPPSGLLELSSFVRQCSLMLSYLFDRQSVVERSALSSRGVVAPIALLTQEDRERVEAELRARFAEFDSNNDGTLDADEFAACLADTSLCLSAQQIESLRREVVQAAGGDERHQGVIQIQHFMTFAYGQRTHTQTHTRAPHHTNTHLASAPVHTPSPLILLCVAALCAMCSQAAAPGA